MKRIGMKVLAFVTGGVCALLLVEGGLRALGGIYVHGTRCEEKQAVGKGLTILCLGDSYVYGVGALREKSFPRQLEQLLDRRLKPLYTR